MKSSHDRASRLLTAALLTAALWGLPAFARAQGGYGQPVLLANWQDERVRESSGLAASRRTPGVFWTHNDSGDGPHLYATDRKGRPLARFTVTGATAVDWEDMAAGPGQGRAATLYIGDIGDNSRSRKDTVVYRVQEPAVDMRKTGQTGATQKAERLPFVYPDGHHDAETLLVHPVTGEVFILTKAGSGVSGIYRFPLPLTPDQTVTLEKVGTVTFTSSISLGRQATGGDISPDGKRIVLRTYLAAYEWTVGAGQSVAEALSGSPRAVTVPILGQFEAICYVAGGKALLTTSEGAPCPLWKMPGKKQTGVARRKVTTHLPRRQAWNLN